MDEEEEEVSLVPLRPMHPSEDEDEEQSPVEPESLEELSSLLPFSKAKLDVTSLLEDEDEEDGYGSNEKIGDIESFDLGFDGNETEEEEEEERFSWRKLWLYAGPGFLMSIAFLDPGNLEGDLQSGAIAGYSLLWLLLWATLMGLLIQLLSARLGVVTGKNLAEICREEYPNWARFLIWGMTEIALIGADIQEVIGSAIAIKILSNGFFPIWAGVLITALDCFVFLFLENYGVRKLEAIFAILIAIMAISFAWMFQETKPNGKDLLLGILVPKLNSNTIKQAVGVIGCVIMPHNIYLHSALVQSRKINPKNTSKVKEALKYYSIESTIALIISFFINLCVTSVFAKGFYKSENAEFIGLENAGEYLNRKFGGAFLPILYIWGIGLLSAGQSSTITGTYAGQFIMSGFLNLTLTPKPYIRALITRSSSIIPTLTIALIFGASESALDVLNEYLNVLQSVQIPFALVPLLSLVGSERIMGGFKIGRRMKVVTWTVAALLMIINAYLLLDFVSKEIRGLLLGSLISVFILLYAVFILYLILRDTDLPDWFVSQIHKRF